jgi:hypothetical protein
VVLLEAGPISSQPARRVVPRVVVVYAVAAALEVVSLFN